MTASGESRLEALAEQAADGGWIVRAPRVGIYRPGLHAGARRGPGEAVGRLTILDRGRTLVLPAGVGGLVSELHVPDRAAPVAYGQALLRIEPEARAAPATGRGRRPSRKAAVSVVPRPATAAAGEELPPGASAVRCPIDGVFYGRPAPGAPPFVEVGSVVEAGRTLGLVEAMKSFNAVIYGGPGLPSPAVVAQVRAADGTEVRQETGGFVVTPAPA